MAEVQLRNEYQRGIEWSKLPSGGPGTTGITLQQVKDDIASGKCKKIFFAQKTLWWTHDPEDIKASTEVGLEFCRMRHKAEMKNPKISRENKARMTGLFNNFMKAKNRPPLDFTGDPLCETLDLKKWIEGAEQNVSVFGRNGLDAFMRMHHKNCQGKAFDNWDQVNFDIDGIPVLTNVVQAPVKYMAGRVYARMPSMMHKPITAMVVTDRTTRYPYQRFAWLTLACN